MSRYPRRNVFSTEIDGGVGGSGSSTPAASTLAEWDAHLNLSANNMNQGWQSQATASTPINLTVDSAHWQTFTGSTACVVNLPPTCPAGFALYIENGSTATLTLTAPDTSVRLLVTQGNSALVFAKAANPTAASQWGYRYFSTQAITGKSCNINNTLTLNGTDFTTITFPSASDTLVGRTSTDTLTNKTLTTPAISSPTGLVKADVGLGNVDNTSDATKTATLDGRYEPLEQFAILTSAYTLANQTAAQQLLNHTTNGAVTLPVGDYFFECAFSLSAMSSTSGAFGFGFGGTAAITQDWVAVTAKPTSLASAAGVVSWNTANSTNIIGAANVNTLGIAHVRGRITVTTAGTLIPQVSLTVAAAAIVGAGAFFRIQSVNSAASYAGAWS